MKKHRWNKIQVNRDLLSVLLLSTLSLVILIWYRSINIDKVSANRFVNEISYTQNTYSDEVELNSASKYNKNITTIKNKYKKIFEKKLWEKLGKMKTKTLEKLNERIEEIIKKVEVNKYMDDDKKEKTLWQYIALMEVIEEEIEIRNDLMIDLDKIFEV